MAITELDARHARVADASPRAATASSNTDSRPVLRRRVARRAGRLLSRWWAIVALVVTWQLWVSLAGFNSIVLPTPLDVAADLVSHPGAYAGDTARTFGLAMLGITIGMTMGFAIAVVTWASSLVAGAISPLVLMLRSIPIVAVIPVVARLVGYGNKIVPIVTIMLAFFPAYVMTSSGLRAASATSRDLMTALGASRWTMLRRLLIPTAVPNLLVALRLCASSAVLAAMVAEFLAGTNGLGRLFSSTRVRFENERAWGAALIATALSVVFFQVALRIERWGRHRFR